MASIFAHEYSHKLSVKILVYAYDNLKPRWPTRSGCWTVLLH